MTWITEKCEDEKYMTYHIGDNDGIVLIGVIVLIIIALAVIIFM